MEIDTGMVVFGKNALTDFTCLIDSAFGEQDHRLTEFGIRTLRNEERGLQMGAQLTLHRLYLDLDATRTDYIVLTTQDAELSSRQLGDIVGDKALRTDFWSIDDETTVIIETYFDRRERGIIIGGIRTIQATEGDMREGLRHAVSAPNVVRKGLQCCGKGIVDGASTDNEVTDLFQTFTLLRHLKRVINLHRHHGSEV